jgi:butyryl-CoA dehydrogenase
VNPLLSVVEQRVRDEASELAVEHVAPLAAEIDGSGTCPDRLVELLCARISERLDGTGPTPMHLALRLEQIGRYSAAAAAIAATHGIGAVITQQHSSAAISVEDTPPIYATVCGRGDLSAEGCADSAVLQGTVGLVPGAAYATIFLVACEQGAAAGVFSVDADIEGVTVGPVQPLMGLAGSGTASLTCNDVRLASSARVGDLELARTVEDTVRVAHAAQAVGIAAGALDAALGYVSSTRAAEDTGKPPQAIQWMLADIATESEAARLLLWYAALALEVGDAREAAAACRLLAAEAAVAASRRAVQVAGEQGTLRTSVLDRLYRDAKVMEVLGGTNEDQLGVIAAGLLPGL